MSYQQPNPPDPNYPTPPQYSYPQQPYPSQPAYRQPPYMESPYPPPQPYPPQPPQKRDANLPLITTIATATLLIVAVVVVLAVRPGGFLGNSPAGNAPGAQNTTQTTPNAPQTTPTSAPPTSRVLYQADWSTGFDGWTGSNQWSVSNGVLSSDGSGTGNILAPYAPESSDYVVDASIHVIGAHDSFFGIVTRGQGGYSNLSGYIAGMAGVTDNGGGDFSGKAAISFVGYSGNAPSQVAFDAGSGWHTYRAVVSGNTISLFIDGRPYVHFVDSTFSAGGQVGLRAANGTSIAVRSFVVSRVSS